MLQVSLEKFNTLLLLCVVEAKDTSTEDRAKACAAHCTGPLCRFIVNAGYTRVTATARNHYRLNRARGTGEAGFFTGLSTWFICNLFRQNRRRRRVVRVCGFGMRQMMMILRLYVEVGLRSKRSDGAEAIR